MCRPMVGDRSNAEDDAKIRERVEPERGPRGSRLNGLSKFGDA